MVRIKATFAMDMRSISKFERDLERAIGEFVATVRVSRSVLAVRTSTAGILELRGRFDLTDEAALLNNSVLRSAKLSRGGKLLFLLSGFEIAVSDLEDTQFQRLFARNALNATGSPFDDILVGGPANDVLGGAGGHDRLNGAGGNDTLVGGGGDDRLNGGRGTDIMRGGGGRDTYWVDEVRDRIIEAGAGHDRVHATASYRLPALVEDLVLGGAARIDATGNGLGNILIGNRAVNVLDGRGGHDVLDGGAGADRMLGGPGHDTYFVDNRGDRVIEQAGQGTDTVWSTISYALPGNVENLQLRGSTHLNGTGNGLDNVLIGNRGANVLDGRGGDDWLSGGGGADTLTGGSGADDFVFDTDPTATPDIITDFASGVDHIVLDTNVFTALTAGPLAATQFRTSDVAADGDDYLVYDSASGLLSYDSSGSGAVELAPIATLGAGATLAAADIIAAPDILPGLLFNGGQFTYRPDTVWSTGLVFQADSDGGFTQTINLV